MEKTRSHAAPTTLALWQHPGWYGAVTLTERIASSQDSTNSQPMSGASNMEKARRCLQRWKEQAPFDKEACFAARLAAVSLTEGDLLTLLAEPLEAIQARLAQPAPPGWLAELLQAFEGPRTFSDILPATAQMGAYSGPVDFLQPVQPLLHQGVTRLETAIQNLVQQYAELPFDVYTIVSLLFAHLPGQVLSRLDRTLVLELHVARLRGYLDGETPEERFQSYIRLLGQSANMLSLFEEYCVLARQLVVTIDQWVSSSLELMHRLCADWEQIRATFVPEGDPGVLIEVRAGAGDAHRGGRSVVLLKFSSGLQLVYKPKSLAIDAHFQELLTWLNEQGQQPALRTLKLIDKGSYGWTEFIVAAPCLSEAEVARFYERQGAYLALLYALEAVDFHYENVIAVGEHPMLIDLEALFHPRVGLVPPEIPVHRVTQESVLRVGLLPNRRRSRDGADGPDMSGLGGWAGQLTAVPASRWEKPGTDEMYLVRERVEIPVENNRPRLNGREVRTLHYCEHIISGFMAMYRLLVLHRDEFLTALLPRLAHDEIRFLARATRVYRLLLFESFHPSLLRDALQRERCFDRLWLAAQDQPYLSRLIAAERADLLQGDIPLFTTRPDCRDLYTSRGEPIPAFFAESSLERVGKRLAHLNEEDLARQIWLIRAALTGLATEADGIPHRPLPTRPSHAPVTRERLADAASAVGDRLCRLAVHSEDAVGWLSVVPMVGYGWDLRPADIGLYHGNSGIALFLSYLGHLLRQPRYTALARLALKTINYEVAQLKKHSRLLEIGAFTGLGSVIYLFTHLGTLWNEPALLQEAEELVALLPDLIVRDDRLDILAGSAGCIASLLSLYAARPSTHTLAVSIQCGDHLLARAQPMPVGLGWRTLPQQPPQVGFAHGAAGIAWSLLKLAEVSGQERFRHTALAALAYERSLFSPEKQNWPTLYTDSATEMRYHAQAKPQQEQKFRMGWAHGAPGIGLGRLGSLGYTNDPIMQDEVTIALKTTIAQGFGWNHEGFGPNHSLTHGDFGNLEVLLMAVQTLKDPQYHQQLDRITAILLDSIDAHGWVTGIPLDVETPGLMIGLAGIGYALLRLAEPEKVPSVLLLAPPCSKRSLRAPAGVTVSTFV